MNSSTPFLILASILSASLFAACESTPSGAAKPTQARNDKARIKYPAYGEIRRTSPKLDALIAPGATIEKLASGFQWSEGPVWLPGEQSLVFSDVIANTNYKWKEGEGISTFLRPSGYTGATPRKGEPGSNGLTLDKEGRLTSCEHGDRRVARLEKDGSKTTLAHLYNGKQLNSPNDLVYKSNGDIYFTDPSYGLEGGVTSKDREQTFNGVYRIRKSGEIDLLTKDISFPNGIAFSPDEKRLYVAVSDNDNPVVMIYDVEADGTIKNGKVFFDAKTYVKDSKDAPGNPDGLKVDVKGNLFVAGAGGIMVLSPEGEFLGSIHTGQQTANCAWGEDGTVLYMTANHEIARISTLTRGKMPGK